MMNIQQQATYEQMWPRVQIVVRKILSMQNISKDEWQNIFSDVHQMTLWEEGAAQKIKDSLTEMIIDFIRKAQQRVMQNPVESILLKAYITEWTKFFSQCEYLPQPFSSLENFLGGKQHLSGPKKNQLQESLVRKLMLDSWNHSIFKEIKHRLQDSAMKLVYDERNGEVIDCHLVIGVRESYVNLSTNPDEKLRIYEENFERAYLESTEKFYRQRAAEYLQSNGVQNYMAYAYDKLIEEEKRASRYLEVCQGCNSVQKLKDTCVEVLVTAFKEPILSECPRMIRNNETEKLKLMFTLLDRVPNGVNPMLTYLEEHIRRAGLNDMKEHAQTITTDSEKYVERLLELFHRFTAIVEEAFSNDPRFLTSRDKAYRDIVNDTSIFHMELSSAKGSRQPESRCPEMLANYCDMLLRKTPTTRRLTSEDIERKLKEVLLVLKYVQNKDVFIRFHKSHLTRRLILECSADNEMEENMVEWLRTVGMPADIVNKLARMFQDIKVSEDLNQEFKDSIRVNSESIADMVNIKILNSGAWMRPSYRIPLSLPRGLEDYIPQVEEFYRQKHQGRTLFWNHLMSNGIISFENAAGKFQLEVTTFQMAILFAWNSRPKSRLTFESLSLATGLPEAELKRTLWSLIANPKLKRQVILYYPEVTNPKDLSESTEFWINQEFAVVKNNRLQKCGKLNLIGRMQLQTERVREEENKAIIELRKLRTQEGIIRIMKMRKRLHHAELYTELVELLKFMFVPSKKLIKEVIEGLIDEQYMRRDDHDMNVFIYVA